MDDPLFCPDCREQHLDPADAGLGHLIRCLACAFADETVPERPYHADRGIDALKTAA